jgi:hypothetical protein
MCDQPGNKYDLERIRDRAGEPLRDYIRRFSDMRFKIPKISHDEAASAFIKGLCHHDTLRSKLLWKRPTTVSKLLATAKNYVDADDAEKIIKDDKGGSSRPDNRNDHGQNDRDRHNDNRNFPDNRDRRHDRRNAFRGKCPREDDHKVNAVKKPSGHQDYQEDYDKALKGPC